MAHTIYMSTQFTSRTTGEWAFTRWWGGRSHGGMCCDFGADMGRTFDCMDSCEDFDGDDGSTMTATEFAESMRTGTWTQENGQCNGAEFTMTFGEFGGTFEMGSGDMATFGGF